MSDVDQSYERLLTYLEDLDSRIKRQAEWHAAHPEWPTCASLQDAPNELLALHFDECPSTMDIVTSERFSDLIRVSIAALREARRG